jgi:arsenate reductase (glutaredoxin)
MVTIYGIPNCDSVKKARAWLAEHAVATQFYDFKKSGLPQADAVQWAKAVGWAKLINRQSSTWRNLSDAQRQALGASCENASACLNLALAQPSVIKRPVVAWSPKAVATSIGTLPLPTTAPITVGFDAVQFSQMLTL